MPILPFWLAACSP
jgi:AcrR family transcriptional regulator